MGKVAVEVVADMVVVGTDFVVVVVVVVVVGCVSVQQKDYSTELSFLVVALPVGLVVERSLQFAHKVHVLFVYL